MMCRYAGVLGGGLVGRTTERVAQLDAHARTHGRAERDLLHVVTLHAGRLGLHDGIDEGAHGGEDLVLAERRLADTGMDQAGLLEAELDLAADRKSGVQGKRVSVRVALGGRRIIKKTPLKQYTVIRSEYNTK